MEKITVTQNGADRLYMSYLYGKVTDKFSFLPAECELETDGDRIRLVLSSERKYCPYIRSYTEENIAEIIAVGYKYRYFSDALFLPMLSGAEKDILLTALVAADLVDDKEYIKKQLKGADEYCIDGTFRFRLGDLKSRWKGIAEYIPSEFSSASLESFLDFLIGESDGKAFLKDGKLYDEDYRKMNRSALIGQATPTREILLSGADNIYCFGTPDPATKNFLKKYYKEKVVFC